MCRWSSYDCSCAGFSSTRFVAALVEGDDVAAVCVDADERGHGVAILLENLRSQIGPLSETAERNPLRIDCLESEPVERCLLAAHFVHDFTSRFR